LPLPSGLDGEADDRINKVSGGQPVSVNPVTCI